jgi:hypothetical protein
MSSSGGDINHGVWKITVWLGILLDNRSVFYFTGGRGGRGALIVRWCEYVASFPVSQGRLNFKLKVMGEYDTKTVQLIFRHAYPMNKEPMCI